MIKEVRCIVKGRVRGVMYRDFTQRNARGLDIVGTVENLPDNSVEIVAQGEEGDLKKFIEILQKGPILTRIKARVDKVEVVWSESTKSFFGFKIIY
ncbi:MAG: acylphosphatase [Parcubacteria group bacterium]|nr:acylphosphatase [Parcubacteria group bacterium]